MGNGVLKWAVAGAFAVLLGITAGMLALRPDTVSITSGTMLKAPRPIDDFQLRAASGAAFTKADLAGHWTVVFAGFTYCPDVCPTTLTELKAVNARLGDAAKNVRFLFLSVDPERDTPEKIGKYVNFFDPRFQGATGDTAALDKLGANLGFVYTKVKGATPGSYTIDHSTALILIDPQGRIAGYLTPPFKPDAMAADLKTLVANNP